MDGDNLEIRNQSAADRRAAYGVVYKLRAPDPNLQHSQKLRLPFAPTQAGRGSSAPPTYTPSLQTASRSPMAIPAAFHFVKLPASISTAPIPSTERCHTHLKLLGSFHKLYVQISSSNGLLATQMTSQMRKEITRKRRSTGN